MTSHRFQDLGGGSISRSAVRARGLTLLELIIVLVILATLGTVMITQTAGLADEARYEQTVNVLERLDEAVLGRPAFANEDPTSVPAGFVADMGRLPQIGSAGNLAELYDRDEANPTTPLPLFDLRPAEGDSSLNIASGWRGPYLRLGVGSDAVRDGWGRALTLRDPFGVEIDTSTALSNTEIGSIISFGVGTGDAFDVDLEDVVFLDDPDPLLDEAGDVNLVQGSLDLTIDTDTIPAGANERVLVRVYGPADGLPVVLAQWPAEGAATWPAAIPEPLVFEDLIVGPRYLRVYRLDGSTGPPSVPGQATDVAIGVLADTAAASSVIRFTVQHGGTSLPTEVEVP
ncbi:MAG: prepilin-type N-terminal cleavage/methylation domain-containing protein [Planctomycetota bacterium]